MSIKYKLPARGEFGIAASYKGPPDENKDKILGKALGKEYSSGYFLGSKTASPQRDIARTFQRKSAGEKALQRLLQLKKTPKMFRFKIEIAW